MVAKLAAHYYRPEFTEAQVAGLFEDFVKDLHGYDLRDIEAAITQYRRDPANKFFPHPGAIVGILKRELRDRPQVETSKSFDPSIYTHRTAAKPGTLRSVAEILAEKGR